MAGRSDLLLEKLYHPSCTVLRFSTAAPMSPGRIARGLRKGWAPGSNAAGGSSRSRSFPNLIGRPRDLSPRPRRLRPQPAPSALAERRADRGADRAQLRGGWRELHPAWRCCFGGVPVGDRRRPTLAGPAAHEYGIDVRIRLTCRLLADLAAVAGAKRSRHRVQRRHGARPPSRYRRGHEGGRLGDRLPRPEMDRLPRLHPRGGEGAYGRGDPHPHGDHRRAAVGLVHGPLLGPHPRSRRGSRLHLARRFLRRRPALLDRGTEADAASWCPTRWTPTT